jgi:uncharacterized protein (DUF433 family)
VSGTAANVADRIGFNPADLEGKPTVRDTRGDIQAALRYAADSIAHEVVVLRVSSPER